MNRWVSLLGVAAVLAISSPAAARSIGEKPAGMPAGQARDIQKQEEGNYPALKRDVLPLGAINKKWSSDCGQESTTLAVAYSPNSEIRFRVRQLLGTVVAFPEAVAAVSQPGGVAFSAKPYGPDGAKSSQVWVFGTTKAGVDGNYVFIGGKSGELPRLYLVHVQSEGFNTKECPDLMVLVKGATSADLDRAAAALKAWARSVDKGAIAAASGGEATTAAAPAGVADGPKSKPQDAGKREDLTGRGKVDWLGSKPFDPAALNFNWKVYGEKSLAPDVVFSDCCFTYLRYSKKRIEWVRLAAVSAVERTVHGKIDAPVNWDMKGNTVVVQGVQPLTLEREGLYTCIKPIDDPAEDPTSPNEKSAKAEPAGKGGR